MELGALITMILGMIIIWGGLIVSISRAVVVARARADEDEGGARDR